MNSEIRSLLNTFNGYGSNIDGYATKMGILKKLHERFNYDYPIQIQKSHNKIKIKENKKLLKYSFEYFSTLYNGILFYIKTYISWLNLFCYDHFKDIDFKETDDTDINDLKGLREYLHKVCGLDKCTNSNKKLSNVIGINSEKTPSMVNAVHLFKYFITNVKNKKKQNVGNDFCILTNDFINYIKIYFDKIPKFKSAYLKRDFNKYKKKTITFDGAYNLKLKEYAELILEQMNILFERKILLDNYYTDYNYKNTLLPTSINSEKTIRSNVNKIIVNKIKNNTNNTNKKVYSTYLYHTAIDGEVDDEKKNKIMGKLQKASKIGKTLPKFGVYICYIKNNKIKLYKNKNDEFTILGNLFVPKNGNYIKVLNGILAGVGEIEIGKNASIHDQYIILDKTIRVYYKELTFNMIRNNNKLHSISNSSYTAYQWFDIDKILNKNNDNKVDTKVIRYIRGIRNIRNKIKINKNRTTKATQIQSVIRMSKVRENLKKAEEERKAQAEEEERKAQAEEEERKAQAEEERKAIEAQQKFLKQIITVPVDKDKSDKYAELFKYTYKIKKAINFAETDLPVDTYTVSYDGFNRISKISKCKMKYNDGVKNIKCKEFRKYLYSIKNLSPAALKEIIEFIPNVK